MAVFEDRKGLDYKVNIGKLSVTARDPSKYQGKVQTERRGVVFLLLL